MTPVLMLPGKCGRTGRLLLLLLDHLLLVSRSHLGLWLRLLNAAGLLLKALSRFDLSLWTSLLAHDRTSARRRGRCSRRYLRHNSGRCGLTVCSLK